MIRIFSKALWNEKVGDFKSGWLEIDEGRIATLNFGQPQGTNAKKKFLDLSAFHLGPSAVDLHVHARDFSERHKETFESLDVAAAKGGVAVGACLANTQPRLDSTERIREFFQKTTKALARWIPYAAVTQNLEGRVATDWKALLKMRIAGLSDDGRPLLDINLFQGAARATLAARKILSLHEEDTNISRGSLLHLSQTSMHLGIEGSPEEAETSMVERDLKLAKALKAPIHFAHISSQASLPFLRLARRLNIRFSAELCPHHALLDVEVAKKFSLDRLSAFKVCPPIRGLSDQKALHEAVRSGLIDCFASDHAPHSAFEKDLPFELAAHGMIGMEYHFCLFNELRLRAKLPWKTFYRCFNYRPSELLHLGSDYRFSKGSRASFLVFDPTKKQKLKWSASRSSNTPLEGFEVRGYIQEHWMDGKRVYLNAR